jgi:hypothetical protein
LLQGWQLRLTNEIGGLAPGAEKLRYVRPQAHGSWAAALADGLSLHVEAAAGGLKLWLNPNDSLHQGFKAVGFDGFLV